MPLFAQPRQPNHQPISLRDGLALPVAILFASFALSIVAATGLQALGWGIGRIAPWFYAAYGVALILGLEAHRLSRGIERQRIGLRPAALGVPAYSAAAGAVLAVNLLFFLLDRIVPIEDTLDVGEVLEPFLAGPLPEWVGMLAAVLLLACVIPVAEEILFRGFILHSLMTRMAPLRANLLVSGLFAATHLYVWGLPIGAGLYTMAQLGLLSFVLGWAVLRSGSLGPAIAAHGLNNLLALGLPN